MAAKNINSSNNWASSLLKTDVGSGNYASLLKFKTITGWSTSGNSTANFTMQCLIDMELILVFNTTRNFYKNSLFAS